MGCAQCRLQVAQAVPTRSNPQVQVQLPSLCGSTFLTVAFCGTQPIVPRYFGVLRGTVTGT
jgi:hypothetical protein